jgi:anti-sigma regulatory factor (Ser/Thr protein kinase)
MSTCPNCQQNISASARFCPYCGYQQPPEKNIVPPTTVLVAFANPMGTTSLHLGAEDKVIKKALEGGRANVSVDVCHAATIHDLRHALLKTDYRILQFSGHSNGTELIFEDDNGNIQEVNFDAFASFLVAHSPPLECVILNACSTLEQGKLLAFDVPFIIAMKAPIQDMAAIEFSRGFYDVIAVGKNVEFAYQEGRRCVQMMTKSESDLPVLVKHTILDKYQNLPLGVRSNEYQRWHDLLAAGKLELRIDAKAINEVNVLLSILDKVLQEKGFEKDTIDRAAIILWELVSNVARHVKNSQAKIGLEVNTKYLPMVIVSVADQGQGLDLEQTVINQFEKLKSGAPEHGLGRACRLSDDISQKKPSVSDPYHTIYCTLYTVHPPKSIFDQFPWTAKITVFYKSPYSVWIGDARYPSGGYWGITNTFDYALTEGNEKLLEIYLQPLLLNNPHYLCFEVQGVRYTTECLPGLEPTIARALGAYFTDFFKQNRVIFLSKSYGPYVNADLKNGIENYFDSSSCLRRLEEIDRELKKRN